MRIHLCLVALCCSLGGCITGMPFAAPGGLERVEALERLQLGAEIAVAEVELLALSDEMRHFAAQQRAGIRDPALRLQALHHALFDPGGLGIVHLRGRSRTAREVFELRGGDCLSLANLFIALARAAGVDARYQEVRLRPAWTQRADLLVLERHVNVAGRLGGGVEYTVDFLDLTGNEVAPARIASDRRALGLHYNNAAVDHLTRGELAAAIAHFKHALRTDSGLEIAWSNLGASYRRAGESAAAEAAYLEALDLDPENESAAGNLAALYQQLGRAVEAAHYAGIAEQHRLRNPYYRAQLADTALVGGDLDRAVREYRRALALAPGEERFRAGLALAEERRDTLRQGRASPAPEAAER